MNATENFAPFEVFISYSHADIWLADALSDIIRIVDRNIFRDVDNIKPGERWRLKIFNAIEKCDKFMLIWCKHAALSEEVKREYEAAIEWNKEVVPLLLDSTPLPLTLAEFQYLDLRKVLGEHAETLGPPPGYVGGCYPAAVVPADQEMNAAALMIRDFLVKRLKEDVNDA